MKHIIRYECDYCQTSFDDDIQCAYHENDCDKNPHVRSCGTCDHLKSFFGKVQARILYCKQSHNLVNDDFKGAWQKHCEHWEGKL